MNLDEIVMKLIGPVQAIGDSRIDEERLKNMKHLTWLVDRLLFEIETAAADATRTEHSMRLIGEKARDFLKEVKSA